MLLPLLVGKRHHDKLYYDVEVGSTQTSTVVVSWLSAASLPDRCSTSAVTLARLAAFKAREAPDGVHVVFEAILVVDRLTPPELDRRFDLAVKSEEQSGSDADGDEPAFPHLALVLDHGPVRICPSISSHCAATTSIA
jgi:hypothetical protein